jgi:hypothetical protein
MEFETFQIINSSQAHSYHIFSPGRTFCPSASGYCVEVKVHTNVVFQEIPFLKENFGPTVS